MSNEVNATSAGADAQAGQSEATMNEHNKTADGADWAMWDAATANRYGGSWVVAVPNEVIEFGTDPLAVRDRAAAKLGLPPDEVVVCAVATLESRVWC